MRPPHARPLRHAIFAGHSDLEQFSDAAFDYLQAFRTASLSMHPPDTEPEKLPSASTTRRAPA
jgi:hypothetical protein